MSSKMKISYHNYDVVLKDSFSVFDNKVLDFLKLDIPRIKGFIETEFATIERTKSPFGREKKLTQSYSYLFIIISESHLGHNTIGLPLSSSKSSST